MKSFKVTLQFPSTITQSFKTVWMLLHVGSVCSATSLTIQVYPWSVKYFEISNHYFLELYLWVSCLTITLYFLEELNLFLYANSCFPALSWLILCLLHPCGVVQFLVVFVFLRDGSFISLKCYSALPLNAKPLNFSHQTYMQCQIVYFQVCFDSPYLPKY